jgi:hypothetical protein
MCPPMHNVSVRIILHERANGFSRAAAGTMQHYARSTRFRGVWGGRDDDAALADTLGFMFLFATVRVLLRRAH